MNHLFDIHGHLDGYVLTYECEPIWVGNTVTGAIRAMIEARAAFLDAHVQLSRFFPNHIAKAITIQGNT